ncbi:hypothetical protein RJ879_34340, partial [Pseudomonas aeruginosa]|uniref:H-NS family histone-like protein n=1 Tax=Pseudomonas aeruginosa TaxID=287 RepID=UPI00304B4909
MASDLALKILNNIRTLRAQARECTLETLEEMLEKLEVVVNERREEESAAAAEVEERTRKLQQVGGQAVLGRQSFQT